MRSPKASPCLSVWCVRFRTYLPLVGLADDEVAVLQSKTGFDLTVGDEPLTIVGGCAGRRTGTTGAGLACDFLSRREVASRYPCRLYKVKNSPVFKPSMADFRRSSINGLLPPDEGVERLNIDIVVVDSGVDPRTETHCENLRKRGNGLRNRFALSKAGDAIRIFTVA
jgi:hypothetical protein